MIASGKSGELIKLAGAKLWSPDTPHLYDLKIKAGDDAVDSYFGLRKIEVSPDEKGIPRIKLNGQSIMQVGPLDPRANGRGLSPAAASPRFLPAFPKTLHGGLPCPVEMRLKPQ